jgi:cytochrome P450
MTWPLALTAYLQAMVRERRASPDDSILPALIAAEEEGDRLSSGEVVRMVSLLLAPDRGGPARHRVRRRRQPRPGDVEQPDEFRIDRPDPGRHMSFSLGMHHCLGSSLARLEGRIAIEELTRRCPALELAAPPTRRSLLVLRGQPCRPVGQGRWDLSRPAGWGVAVW